MDREEALKLLRGGEKGVAEWNRRRKAEEPIPELRGACLRKANLRKANLHKADLGGDLHFDFHFHVHSFDRADLSGANLRDACLSEANLRMADFRDADLRGADLVQADLYGAYLNRANLGGANLNDSQLSKTDLSAANLRGASLREANFRATDLKAAEFEGAKFGFTNIGSTGLCEVSGLEKAMHAAPSTIGVDTLVRSKGRIPEAFLRGCGLTDLEIEFAKLYDPARSALQVAEITNRIAELRMQPIAIGGVFISYSWDDLRFVDKLYECLQQEKISVWLDKHEMVAGPVKRQVVDAIRVKDVVVLVLSEGSVDSDWVEYELEAARKKEKAEQRDVLCPVALDEAWKARMDDPLWRQVKKDYVVDFSGWENEAAFEAQFKRLLKGLKIYYEPPAGGPLGKMSAKG